MAVKQLVYLLILLVLCVIIYEAATQQCSSNEGESSILGMMLQRHIFKKIMGVSLGHVCLRECYLDARCQSFNFVISKDVCELNNRTKEARPDDFVPNFDRYYFRRDWNRVPLGSIPELPAETCKEIKLSEEGQAISGKHWFYSIIPEKTVLAYCDMNTEDIDECSASVQVCDTNANCENIRGSYLCSCKAGFTGDGKTCKDVDECADGSYTCDVNAHCNNTVGSYNCTCKPTYYGNGKSCKGHRGLDASIILGSLDRNKYSGKLMSYLEPVLLSSDRSVFLRCWNANTDGWAATTFHSNCDGKGPTVTIIKVNDYIFGGYTDVSWNSSSPCVYSAASKAFLLSLHNINGYAPVNLTQYDDLLHQAIYSCSSHGPTFGGFDIYISNDALSNSDSHTHCGHTYTAPPGYSRHSNCPFFAGSFKFSPTDIEVFYESLT